MQQIIEQQLHLPRVSVLLANIEWNSVASFHPTVPGYYITQRLSENHAPLRFENPAIGEVFPSVRSIGLLPPTFAVSVSPPAAPFRGLSCVFAGSYFEAVTGLSCEQWHERAGDFLDLPNQQISVLMERIHTELVRPCYASEIAIEAASNLLLVEIARGLQSAGEQVSGRRAGVRGGLASWQLRRIRGRLDAVGSLGYPAPRELAQLCGVSEGHLMRAFKVSTGASLHQFISRQRILAAQQLLREPDRPLAQIAQVLGFSSPAYFSAAFRRACGMAPSEYRRRSIAGVVVISQQAFENLC